MGIARQKMGIVDLEMGSFPALLWIVATRGSAVRGPTVSSPTCSSLTGECDSAAAVTATRVANAKENGKGPLPEKRAFIECSDCALRYCGFPAPGPETRLVSGANVN